MKKSDVPVENCIIWPPNMSTADEGKPCWIHRIEQKRLGIGGEYSIQAEAKNRVLIIRECVSSVDLQLPYDEDGNVVTHMPPRMTFIMREVNRRGQFVDMGGYYLDPGPWLMPPGDE